MDHSGLTDATSLPTRRDRLRAATMEEITGTARRLLVEQGPEAASLRAIAREMGMTAPGLYRYYGSREELFRHVVAQIFRELADGIHEAIDEAQARCAPAADKRVRLTIKMIAACREFRRWALANRKEFALLFGVPLPGVEDVGSEIVKQSVLEFAGTFYALFAELWETLPLPVPEASEGAVVVFMHCWVLLYGAVSIEIYGHTAFTFCASEAMFEFVLGDLARVVGLEYPPPPS